MSGLGYFLKTMMSFLGSFGSPPLWFTGSKRDTCLSLSFFSPEKAPPLLFGLFLGVCTLSHLRVALPASFHEGVTPFPCSWSGQTELARGCGLHTETPLKTEKRLCGSQDLLSERATPGVCFV